MIDYKKLALEKHLQYRGKIEIKSKVSLQTNEDMSVYYSPGVAEPCVQIARDISKVYDYTSKGNMIAIVTDGSAVLGLGNIGPEAALPVMEGKAILFKEFANVDAVPICLKTQDADEIISIIKNIAPTFGGINLEDISAPRCFYIEQELKKSLNIPVFHDDQHGTAIVVLAGLINALKLVLKNKKQVRVVVNGAGASGVAVSKLLLRYGFKNIILCDSQGMIYQGRNIRMNSVKEEMSKITNLGQESGYLSDAIVNADIFMGSSRPNVLTEAMVKSMNNDAIVFALANPEPEINPILAKKAGARIIATGRSDYINQINNVLAFPGIFRGVLDAKLPQITDEMKLVVAKALSKSVLKLNIDHILPNVLEKKTAQNIAFAISNM